MERETIKEVLMWRDGMTSQEAIDLIDDAKEAFEEYLSEGDLDSAENICMEYFGLEKDYLDEFY